MNQITKVLHNQNDDRDSTFTESFYKRFEDSGSSKKDVKGKSPLSSNLKFFIVGYGELFTLRIRSELTYKLT